MLLYYIMVQWHNHMRTKASLQASNTARHPHEGLRLYWCLGECPGAPPPLSPTLLQRE